MESHTARFSSLRVDTIVAALRRNHAPTIAEIRFLLDQGDDARFPLLEILADCARWTRIPRHSHDAPLHAVFLLAALDTFEAWRSLEPVLRKPLDTFVDPFFHDNLIETLPWAIARIAMGQAQVLVDMVDDSRVAQYVRASVLQALVVQAKLRPEARAFLIPCLGKWLRAAARPRHRTLADFLAFAVAELDCAGELEGEVRELFSRKLVDPRMICLEEVLAGVQDPCLCADDDILDLYEERGEMIGSHDPARATERGP